MNDEEVVERLQQYLERKDANISETVCKLYAVTPAWIPDPVIFQIKQCVESLLNAEQTPDRICWHVANYLEHKEFDIPGTALDTIDFVKSVNYLAHVKWAITQGPKKGLAALAGNDAVRGRKVHQGAQAGHAATHGTREAKQAKYNSYQLRVDELHSRNPRRSHWEICKIAANDFDVSPKTIQRHTEFR